MQNTKASYDHFSPTLVGGVASADKWTKSKGLDGVIAQASFDLYPPGVARLLPTGVGPSILLIP
jgi:hypothetical protein